MAFTQWIRVKDRSTGHEYDVAPSAVDPEAHEVLKDYPPNLTGLPRDAKHRVARATAPAAATTKKPRIVKATAPAATTKEK